jgi:hypothetical protein
VSLAALQALTLACLAAVVLAFGMAGASADRKVAGVDCERVKARAGHVSPWEVDACR